jgi:hypothetical protein
MKRIVILIALLAMSLEVFAQESYIQVPPDSSGKKIRHYQALIGGNTVYIPGNFLSTTAGVEIGLVSSPIFVRFTDGAAAYDAAKASQLPAALVGGRLDVNIGNTPAVTVSGSVAVTGPLTDTQLRASAVPVSATALPLPTGAATEGGNLATIVTNTGRIPSSPSTDRTTAAAPFSMRLSDGAAFIDPRDVSDRSGRALGTIANTGFNVNNSPTVNQGTAAASTAGWPIAMGTVAASSAAWTNATSVDSALSISTAGYATAVLTLNPVGSVTSGTLNFEVSDDGGTTWYPAIGVQQDITTAGVTTTASATTKKLYTIPVVGYTNVRARLNPVVGGSGTVNLRLSGSAAPRDSMVAVTTSISTNLSTIGGFIADRNNGAASTGTQRVTIASDSTGSLLNSQGTAATSTWNSATTVDSAVTIAATGYGTVYVSLTVTPTVSSGTVNFEASDDGGTTWRLMVGARQDTASQTSNTGASLTTSTAWLFGVGAVTNFRVRLNPVITGAGSVVVRVQGSSSSNQPIVLVGNTVTTSTGVTSLTPGTAAGNLGKAEDAAHTTGDTGVFVLGVRNDADAVQTSNDGDYSPISTDSSGAAKVVVKSALPAGTNTIGSVKLTDGTNTATVTAGGSVNVNCASGCSAGGSFSDSTAFTFGTTAVGNMSAVVDDTATNTVAENSAGAVRMNTNRILYVDVSKTAANTTAIKVDGSAVTQPTSDTHTTAAAPLSTQLSDGAAFYTGTKTGQLPTALDGSGFLKVHEQGTAAISASSLPLPTGAAQDATLTGGTMTTRVTDGTNTATVKAASTAAGATDKALVVAVSPNNSVAITAASLPLPSTAATDASVTGLQVAQASTTSGQKGTLVQGAVTTAAPTYTTAQTSPLSLTTTGLLRVDGSGVTQPVSGTVTTTPPANASTNVAQLAGTTTDTNSGTKSAGTLRVVIATDQPQLTNKLLVTPDSVALPANQSVNVSQINGVTPLMGNGTTGTGSQRVTVASDNTPFAVKTDQTTHGTTDLVAADLTKIAGTATSVNQGASDAGTQRVVQSQELTYSAGLTVKTATAAGTGVFFSLCGSASKTITIQRFSVSGTVATAAVWGDVILKRTSTATSGGTATTLTVLPYDSNNAAGTAVAKYYTVLATAGTSAGVIDDQTQLFPVTAISATLQPTPAPMVWKWRDPDSQAPVLRGTTQCMEANFGTTTTNAPTLTVGVTWTEK